MAERKVTTSIIDHHGNILGLGNPDYTDAWSPRSLEDIIWDIENQTHNYYVEQPNTHRVYVQVLDWPTGKFLSSPLGCDPQNNIRNIPDEPDQLNKIMVSYTAV